VRSQTISNAFRPPITRKTAEIARTPGSSGSVIVRNCIQADAPSISAAS
jgi:hypothetical protein